MLMSVIVLLLYIQLRVGSYHLYYVYHYNLVDDPLVGSIARQFVNDRRTHDKIARNWTKRYAQ